MGDLTSCCCPNMSDQGYTKVDWAMRIYIFLASTLYSASTNALWYCEVVIKRENPLAICPTQQNVKGVARIFYVLIPFIIIYFYTSAIWSIYQLTRKTENKNLAPDMKTICLHVMCVVV